jgi:hypothetical protein
MSLSGLKVESGIIGGLDAFHRLVRNKTGRQRALVHGQARAREGVAQIQGPLCAGHESRLILTWLEDAISHTQVRYVQTSNCHSTCLATQIVQYQMPLLLACQVCARQGTDGPDSNAIGYHTRNNVLEKVRQYPIRCPLDPRIGSSLRKKAVGSREAGLTRVNNEWRLMTLMPRKDGSLTRCGNVCGVGSCAPVRGLQTGQTSRHYGMPHAILLPLQR